MELSIYIFQWVFISITARACFAQAQANVRAHAGTFLHNIPPGHRAVNCVGIINGGVVVAGALHTRTYRIDIAWLTRALFIFCACIRFVVTATTRCRSHKKPSKPHTHTHTATLTCAPEGTDRFFEQKCHKLRATSGIPRIVLARSEEMRRIRNAVSMLQWPQLSCRRAIQSF